MQFFPGISAQYPGQRCFLYPLPSQSILKRKQKQFTSREMPRLAREVKAYSRGKSKNPKHETALRGEKKKKKQKKHAEN
jgi:hypothetical protein